MTDAPLDWFDTYLRDVPDLLSAQPVEPVLDHDHVVDGVGVLDEVLHRVPRQGLDHRFREAPALQDRELDLERPEGRELPEEGDALRPGLHEDRRAGAEARRLM